MPVKLLSDIDLEAKEPTEFLENSQKQSKKVIQYTQRGIEAWTEFERENTRKRKEMMWANLARAREIRKNRKGK
jgi:hypothetical protein